MSTRLPLTEVLQTGVQIVGTNDTTGYVFFGLQRDSQLNGGNAKRFQERVNQLQRVKNGAINNLAVNFGFRCDY